MVGSELEAPDDEQPPEPYEQPAKPDEALPAITNPLIDHHDMQLRKEEDVGVTEFVSPDLPGFTGILKKRFFPQNLRVYKKLM